MGDAAELDRHLAERIDAPDGYRARPYRGQEDHEAMARILTDHQLREGTPERVSAEQISRNYSRITDCDLTTDVFIVETSDGEAVGYGRSAVDVLASGSHDHLVFAPTMTAHVHEALFHAVATGLEAHHLVRVVDPEHARFRAWCNHPGPSEPAVGESAWLEDRGYSAIEWGASLVRPHLDDIPELPLPDDVEVRPATEDQLRTIMEAHIEAFRGEWDFTEPTEETYAWVLDDPYRDHTLWQVAWAADEHGDDIVVGQVKPFINHDENEERGYRRGYAEYISTHHDWRNRGIAGALLARSLTALRDRGMTEAALGVDTNNPGGAFQLYTKLGFELQAFTAVYARPVAS